MINSSVNNCNFIFVEGVFVLDSYWVGDIKFNDWAYQCSNENKHKRTTAINYLNEEKRYIKLKASLNTNVSYYYTSWNTWYPRDDIAFKVGPPFYGSGFKFYIH